MIHTHYIFTTLPVPTYHLSCIVRLTCFTPFVAQKKDKEISKYILSLLNCSHTKVVEYLWRQSKIMGTHWAHSLYIDLAIRAGSYRIQLLQDPAPTGSGSYRIQLLQDPVPKDPAPTGSGSYRIQLLQDPVPKDPAPTGSGSHKDPAPTGSKTNSFGLRGAR